MLGDPLVLEQGKVDLIAPAALEPLVANEVRFLSHTESGAESKRRLVPRVDPCGHAVTAQSRWAARVYFLAFSLAGPVQPLTARSTSSTRD